MELSQVNLLDPDVFAAGVPHDMFATLRRESPVHWHEEPHGPGFWVLSKHADVRHVSKHPELFSSQRQGTMINDPSPEKVKAVMGAMMNMQKLVVAQLERAYSEA